jgi:hypothetical protein
MTKLTLRLAGTKEGGPTPRHIFALYKSLTGKDVTPTERARIESEYARLTKEKI